MQVREGWDEDWLGTALEQEPDWETVNLSIEEVARLVFTKHLFCKFSLGIVCQTRSKETQISAAV